MNYDIEQLFQQYKDNIFAIGFNYFGNSVDADDVVQETFYKLFRHLKKGGSFESGDHARQLAAPCRGQRGASGSPCRPGSRRRRRWRTTHRRWSGGIGGKRPVSGGDAAAEEIPDGDPPVLLRRLFDQRDQRNCWELSETAVGTQLYRGRKNWSKSYWR